MSLTGIAAIEATQNGNVTESVRPDAVLHGAADIPRRPSGC